MHDVEVADKVGGDGVGQSADGFRAGRVVCEHGEVRAEEVVCVSNGDVEGKPVPGIVERRSIQPVIAQPGIYGSDGRV